MALLKALQLSIACVAAALLCGKSGAAAPTEYEVKAAFLFNFSQFVEWPAAAFADERAALVIGVLGKDPFGASLDEIVRGEVVRGRPLLVQRYQRVEDIEDCHILFIDRSERERLRHILLALAGRPVLTVGDFAGFAQSGGAIRLATVGRRIQLRVNLQAAQAANLTISSKLLRRAHIVAPVQE